MSRRNALRSKRRKAWMREFEESPRTRLIKDAYIMIEQGKACDAAMANFVRSLGIDACKDACGLSPEMAEWIAIVPVLLPATATTARYCR